MTVDWTVLNAVAAACAAAFAGFALLATLGLLVVEARRDRARDRGDREELARQITGWFGPETNADGTGRSETVWRAAVENHSIYPIFDVKISVYEKSDLARAAPVPVRSRDVGQALREQGGYRAEPDTAEVIAPRGNYHWCLTSATAYQDVSPFVDLEFTDAHARRWRMTKVGRLKQLRDQ